MDNKIVNIGLIQNKVVADRNINLQTTIELVEQAAKGGAQIICLQELYNSIYFPQYQKANKKDYAETIPGESTSAFSKIAKKYQTAIIVPIFEKTKDGKYYNSAAVMNTDGKLMDVYHKVHIPHDPCFYEKNYFDEGTSGYKIYKTKYADFAVLICYDQWFPEAARTVTLQGADIIFYPTAIGNVRENVGATLVVAPEEGDWHDAWETVMRGHAIANGVHIVAVNRVGAEDKLDFWGQSFVCDAFGKILQRASNAEPEILLCQVNLSQNQLVRDGWGFFKNRRIDTYQC